MKTVGYIHIVKRRNRVAFVGNFEPFRSAIGLLFMDQLFSFEVL